MRAWLREWLDDMRRNACAAYAVRLYVQYGAHARCRCGDHVARLYRSEPT